VTRSQQEAVEVVAGKDNHQGVKADVSGENNPMYGVHRFGKDAPMYGRKFSDEHRRKLSLAKQYTSDITRERMSQSHKGQKVSNETKRKLSEIFRGENSPVAKLTNAQIIEIRKLLNDGVMGEEIKIIFNVSRSTISRIKHNKSYKSIM